MKIALFCAYDTGGAGRAALRLHAALEKARADSTLFVKHKLTSKQNIIQLTSPEINNDLIENVVGKYFYSNIYDGNTILSLMYPSIGFEFLKQFSDYDIYNFHWISTFISLEAIVKLAQYGKPLVWTLHDQNPFTGACHYTHGCQNFRSNCSNCPQMKSNDYNITQALHEVKIKYMPKNLVVVTPSQWLADCARESTVFKKNRIEVIPNSVELDTFKPLDKKLAKRKLGIFANDVRVILFGAENYKERRKGFKELLEAINYFKTLKTIQSLIANKKIYILSFGNNTEELQEIGLPYITLGYVNNDKKLALAYSAADVVVLPSLEDNLPNIILESLACGTPLVSFNVGGMPDAIINGQTGYVVPMSDIKAFAERIQDIIFGEPLNKYCRNYAERHYSQDYQAKQYLQLFHELNCLSGNEERKSNVYIPPMFPEAAIALTPYICESNIWLQSHWNNIRKKLLIWDFFGWLKSKKSFVPNFIIRFYKLLKKYGFKF
jgi:glycosyltransferase involved in cell wall biosynthesis